MAPDETNVAAGGAATVNGVLYQMLWSLLQASRASFIEPPEIQDGEIQAATIILEPAGGGGDLVFQGGQRRYIEQLKVRSGGGTWSLREVIESVIPDLYLANDSDDENIYYRFVTEGRIGRWRKVYSFFQSLKCRSFQEDDPLSDLDDTTPLNLTIVRRESIEEGSEPFWEADEYTERSLFIKIVGLVRKRQAVQDESEETTQRNLRRVLGRFEFVGGQSMQVVQKEIDRHLLAIVDRNDDLSRIRDLLAMELVRRSTQGNAVIQCVDFFREQGLSAVPLTQWGALRRESNRLSDSMLQSQGYDQSIDVRYHYAEQAFAEWPPSAPVMAITGESGSGKSWRTYAMCAVGQSEESLTVLINAGSSVDETLRRASNAVWQDIAGHDESIQINRVARRIQEVSNIKISPWLTLIIDGVIDTSQAIELMRKPWEDWGIRIVITVDYRTSRSLQRESRGRCTIVEVKDFINSELSEYLESFLGASWPTIPEMVRHPLRKPLMANMYRQMSESDADPRWIPHTEYELFASFWERIDDLSPMDRLFAIRLARQYLTTYSYPWTGQDLIDVEAENEVLKRLERIGWLRITHTRTELRVEFPHSRLLNWACAHALLSQFKQNKIDKKNLCSKLKSFLEGTSEQYKYQLCFVPMDFVWLMCQDEELCNELPCVIAGLEGDYTNEVLYEHLLPTLGSQIIGGLVLRLHEVVDNAYQSRLISDSIGKIGGDEAIEVGLALLDEDDPLLRRSALPILSVCPTADALDQLWELHNECQRHPERFCRDGSRDSSTILYEETFAALRKCCNLSTAWLEEKIVCNNLKESETVDLTYLLARVGGEEGARLWRTHKTLLFSTVPGNKRRCLATCIDQYADRESIQWLISNIDEVEDLLGARAFSCLARLAPDEAIQHLDKMPSRLLVTSRFWFLDYLFAVRPDSIQQKLRQIICNESNSWMVADVYKGRQYYMDVETLNMLLGELEQCLSDVLSEPGSNEPAPIIMPIWLLAQVNTKELVEHLGSFGGSRLEKLLCDYVLRIGPRGSVYKDSHVRDEAISLLFRINGDGYITVVNDLLCSKSRYGRWDGIELARKKANSETIEMLMRITEQEETWDGSYLEQCNAALILAHHDTWEPVITLVKKIGLKVLNEVTLLPRRGLRPPPELLNEVADSVLQDPNTATVGDVIVLGFGGQEAEAAIQSVAQICEPDGDVAHGCVIAYEILGGKDCANIDFLSRQLRIDKHRLSAINALIANRTESACVALSDYLDTDALGAIAGCLLRRNDNLPLAIDQIKSAIVRAIEEGSVWIRSPNGIYDIVCRIHSEDIVVQILNDSTIDEFLREESFADEGRHIFTGSKASAIRCLAYTDPRTAFIAAETALRNINAKGREYYPPILAKLDVESAAQSLFAILELSEAEPVKRSIGRSFANMKVEELIIDWLKSSDVNCRRKACYIAGWARNSDLINIQLAKCLNSPEESVARAASDAFAMLALRKETQVLGHAIMETNCADERWLYLECLLDIADPGDQHRAWPIDGSMIMKVLSPLQRIYVASRLKERRKNERK